MKAFQVIALLVVAAAVCQAQDISDSLTLLIQSTESLGELQSDSAAPGPGLQAALANALAPYNIDAKAPGPDIDSKVEQLSPQQSLDLVNSINNAVDDSQESYEAALPPSVAAALNSIFGGGSNSPSSGTSLDSIFNSIFGTGRKLKL
jgi:hypothetical protein